MRRGVLIKQFGRCYAEASGFVNVAVLPAIVVGKCSGSLEDSGTESFLVLGYKAQ